MDYVPITLSRPVTVTQIVSVHYFEYTSNYAFEGEAHDFWEFLYVDKGEVDITAGDAVRRLHKGEMIFHEPGEFHNVRATGTVAPNLVVVGFCCDSPSIGFFRKKVAAVDSEGRRLLSVMVKQASQAFSTPLDDPLLQEIKRKRRQPFGAEQLIALALEWMLLGFLMREENAAEEQKLDNVLRLMEEDRVFDRVSRYLEENISAPLKLEDICRDNMVGRSQLQRLFHKKTGGGVMAYFSYFKIKRAQECIREGQNNFTEISASLGYASLYYFSRQFKKTTGMTPTEYATSVKLLALKTGR